VDLQGSVRLRYVNHHFLIVKLKSRFGYHAKRDLFAVKIRREKLVANNKGRQKARPLKVTDSRHKQEFSQ